MALTKNDIPSLQEIFLTKGEFDLRMDEHEEKIEEHLKQYRSGILDKLDKILQEILKSREEQTVLSHNVSDHEDRISSLEAHS